MADANAPYNPLIFPQGSGPDAVEQLVDVEELLDWHVGPWGPEKRPTQDYNALSHANSLLPIWRLPVELISMVGKDLSSVDRRNFLMASKFLGQKMRTVEDLDAMTENDMMIYTKLRLRDAYNRAVELEDFGKTFDEARACGSCKETHRMEEFVPEELFKPPHLRKCEGLQGFVRVCAHKQLYWRDLPERLGRFHAYVECQHRDHLWLGAHRIGLGLPISSGGLGSVILVRSQVVLRDDGQDDRTLREWMQLLREVDAPVCPHMMLSEFEAPLIRRYETAATANGTLPVDYSGVPPENARITAGLRNATKVVCPSNSFCRATMELVQEGSASPDYHGPYVIVQKHVTIPKFPNARQWTDCLEFEEE